ncbi:MAG: hypothetical protein H0V73_03320 [Chloroflexi bacterium]|nr:hypothetical protein [Chloroflexota bacterium]
MKLAAQRRGEVPAWAGVDVAIAVFVVTAVATTAGSLAQPATLPIGPIPILLALAAFCVAALARRAAPNLAWIATIAGSFAAGSIPIAQARVANPTLLGAVPWLGFAVPAGVGAIVTLAIGAAYACRPERRLGRPAVVVSIGLVVWLVIAVATTIWAVFAGERTDPAFTWIDVATAPIGGFVPSVVVLIALGAIADVRAGLKRVRERRGPAPRGQAESGAGSSPGLGSPAGPGSRAGPGSGTRAGSAAEAWELAVATVRELLPGQSAADERSVLAERTKLAGDLHAVVLPGLRQAIAEAEAGGDPDALARRLRTVDLELERLMADRWPVVLDAFGLVAALEDLAERIEADTALDVTIDVERAGERPPLAIERAAWRVAQVAVDNVVRHAAATTITLTVAVEAERLHLVVGDDGRGFDPTVAGAIRSGARGLADASRRAATVGADVRVEPGADAGTVVVFDWSRPAR